MTIIVDGGAWKREIEIDTTEVDKDFLYIEAVTRAIELEHEENDNFDIGVAIIAYDKKNKNNINTHIAFSSYIALCNAGLFSIAESMKQFFKDAYDIDISINNSIDETKKKKP